ncbi:MAG: replication initiator protein A [bacterium]|nr:replication initiator protein A [bacterium]
MTLKAIPDEDNILLSGDELKHALEKQLADLLGVIASHDEKIADLEAIKVRYQRIIDASPENESAAQEIVELQGDIVPLVASRNFYAIERQTIREQIKTLSTPSVADAEPKIGGPLLAKIEAMRQRAASRAMTPDLFGDTQLDPGLANTRGEVAKVEDDKGEKRERSKLLPARYTNQDFFVADILGYSLKDDQATMEAPVFSLKTQKDLTPWEWTSKDGTKHIEVSPSVKYGRATQHDKDVLIFVTSQMTEALNRERPDVQNRAVRFTVHNYLVATNKPTGGVEYQRFERALDRLKGTTIKTDIRTGEKRVKEAFGILDSWTIVERSPGDERMIAVEVTMSKWLYNAIHAHEVLTLHADYFRLRKPLERRLYELARKHCGRQSTWRIGLELLRERCGAQSHIRAFRNQIQEVAEADTLPEYRMTYSREADQVTFRTRQRQDLLCTE